MWAVLDTDNKTVIGLIPPIYEDHEAQELAPNNTLVEMTLDNSPAYLLGTWDGTRFHPPKEME